MEGIVALIWHRLVMGNAGQFLTIKNVPMMVEIVAEQIGMVMGVVLHEMITQFVGMMEETVAKETLQPLVTVFVRMITTMQDVALMVGTVVWQASTQLYVLNANARQKMK